MPYGPQVRIRDFREGLGITVQSLVDRILAEGYESNLHPDTIRNVELGYKSASRPLLIAWAKALGVNPLDVYQPAPKPKGGRIKGTAA
jgi:transcriptional regulator with XRE-family HTH domain